MSEVIQEVAVRLYNKLKRSNDGQVSSVGIGKAATGKHVLVAVLKDGAPMICPTNFEGYSVITSVAPNRQTAAGRR